MRKIDADQLIKENFEFLRDNDQKLIGAVRVSKIYSAPIVDQKMNRFIFGFLTGSFFMLIINVVKRGNK